MTRRLLLASALFVIGTSALAQPAAKPARVGFIATTSPLSEISGPNPANAFVRVFVESLREQGYVQGRNLVLDMRSLEGKPERLDAIVADLVREKTDVIFIPTAALVVRAVRVASATPIVAFVGSDLIGAGLVKTLARPGGTVTGPTADLEESVEGKRLEIFLETAPKIRRIAYIGTREEWTRPYAANLRATARRLGTSLVFLESDNADFSGAFARLKSEDADAVFVERSPRAYALRQQIGELAATSGVPSSCSQSELADYGCLLAYGSHNLDLARRASSYVARILKGAKPGDLPIEGPVKFELVVNMTTARTLGITIPNAILLRADRVIE